MKTYLGLSTSFGGMVIGVIGQVAVNSPLMAQIGFTIATIAGLITIVNKITEWRIQRLSERLLRVQLEACEKGTPATIICPKGRSLKDCEFLLKK